MNKDSAKHSHMSNQIRVLKLLDKQIGFTLGEAHKCLIEKGLMSPTSNVPTNWDEVSEKIPDQLAPSNNSVATAHRKSTRIQEAAIA